MNVIDVLSGVYRAIQGTAGATYYSSGFIINANLGTPEIIHTAELVHHPSGYIYFFGAMTILLFFKLLKLSVKTIKMCVVLVKKLKQHITKKRD